MSGVSITGDGDRLRRAHRFPCPGRIIKSTYGMSLEELIIYKIKKLVYRESVRRQLTLRPSVKFKHRQTEHPRCLCQ